MINQEKIKTKHYLTSDLKLSAFLRLMSPDSFIGVNKENPSKVTFVFKDVEEVTKLSRDYSSGKQFDISPLYYGKMIDEHKGLIFGNYDM